MRAEAEEPANSTRNEWRWLGGWGSPDLARRVPPSVGCVALPFATDHTAAPGTKNAVIPPPRARKRTRSSVCPTFGSNRIGNAGDTVTAGFAPSGDAMLEKPGPCADAGRLNVAVATQRRASQVRAEDLEVVITVRSSRKEVVSRDGVGPIGRRF